MNDQTTWVEISRSALEHNIAGLRRLIDTGHRCALAPVIKANAYGHGLCLIADACIECGCDVLCINEVEEGHILRAHGVTARLYVVGPTFPAEAPAIVAANLEVVVFSEAQVRALADAAAAAGTTVCVHVKIETGTHRQGLPPAQAKALIQYISHTSGVTLAGVTTHLADVEDETEHTFARTQLERFERATAEVSSQVWRHCASSAAHILFPDARWDMVRVGIATYGLWPSRETRISADIVHKGSLSLSPVLSWRTRLIQLTEVKKGNYVGYGRAHRVSSDRLVGLLPVGYFDGFDRSSSSKGQVLVNGHRAPVLGRICMNMTMVDVTDIEGAAVGDVVTLIGQDGNEYIGATDLADWSDTINYEIVSRIHSRFPRIVLP